MNGKLAKVETGHLTLSRTVPRNMTRNFKQQERLLIKTKPPSKFEQDYTDTLFVSVLLSP